MDQIFFGQLKLRITCADTTELLNRIQSAHIRTKEIIYENGLVIRITVSALDFNRLRRIVQECRGTVQIDGVSRIHKSVCEIKKHMVGPLVIILLLLLTVFIPRRVLFISVEGNSLVGKKEILEAAENCGLEFGVARSTVRSEVIKNALLQEIPQLQWAGINTKGCTATISVKERAMQEIKKETEDQVCSIVAARDGIIKNCTVYSGNPLCWVGQAVKSGQTLVSGYIDCNTIIKATRADAEITALTFRDLEVITPIASTLRGQQEIRKSRYILRLGKKLIKISKDSGNVNVDCVKIYSESSVRLPGGFVLPISLIRETVINYQEAMQAESVSQDEKWLEDFSNAYLRESMIAGDVVSKDTELIYGDGYACLLGRYACIEMIGQIKNEQMLFKD